jgi:hypothetical protein
MRQWQRWGVKLLEQDYPTGSNNLKEIGSDGMVKLIKLPSTYRHARECES